MDDYLREVYPEFDSLSEEEKEELRQSISKDKYIGESVNKYKKNTTEYMDRVKYLVFNYLLARTSYILFNLKLEEIREEHNKDIIKLQENAYKYLDHRDLDISKIENNKTKELLNKFKLDEDSVKYADDKYIYYIRRFYDKQTKQLENEFIDINEYLAKQVEKFDRVERVVRYDRGTTGAYYDIASYDSMVFNSNLRNIGWRNTIYSCYENNEDLVYVDAHPFACPLCINLQGRYYSLSGKSLVHDSLDYAYENGLGHPNCKHELFRDFGQQETNKYRGAEWEEKYDIRQKKQGLELKRSRIRTDKKIYQELGQEDKVDECNKKISTLNSKIKELKEQMA